MQDVIWSYEWPKYSTVFLTPSAKDLFQQDYKHLLRHDKYWETCIVEEDVGLISTIYQQLERKGSFDVEYRIHCPESVIKWVRHRGIVIFDEQENPVRLDCLFCDISSSKLKALEMSNLAATDSLTGLKNRRFFTQELMRELDKCNRYAQETSLALLDLDHFKEVNDQYGHLAGDLILKEISKILQNLRKADLAARLGGEEFVILMPHTGLDKAAIMAERVRAEIEDKNFKLENGKVIHCTISIGLTSIFQDDTSIEDILRRADQALYMSKNSGRNRVCKFSM